MRENLHDLPIKDRYAYHRLEAFLAVELNNDYNYAEKHMRAAIDIIQSAGNKSMLNSDMGNLAEVYVRKGDYAKAEAILDSIDFHIAGTYQPQYYYCKGMMHFASIITTKPTKHYERPYNHVTRAMYTMCMSPAWR